MKNRNIRFGIFFLFVSLFLLGCQEKTMNQVIKETQEHNLENLDDSIIYFKAIESRDLNLCKKQNLWDDDYCKNEIIRMNAVQNLDYDLCNQITGDFIEGYKEECVKNINQKRVADLIQEKKSSGDVSICNNPLIIETNAYSFCTEIVKNEIAINSNDEKNCESYDYSCFARIGVKKKDYSICWQYSDYPIECTKEIAKFTGDINICDLGETKAEYENLNLEENCIRMGLAKKSGDIFSCNFGIAFDWPIINQDYYDDCINYLIGSNINISEKTCSDLKSENIRYECEHIIEAARYFVTGEI